MSEPSILLITSADDIFKKLQDPRKTLGHKNLYFDTLVHDSYTLDLLKKRVGTSQIIMGLDDPFPLGEEIPGELIKLNTSINTHVKNKLFSEHV